MSRRGDLFAIQMIQQFAPLIIARCELRPGGVIDRHRYITHCPRLPAIHNVNSREFTLVEVHIEHTAHLSSVLHAYSGQRIVFLRSDGTTACKHFDKQIRHSNFLTGDVTAQLFPDRQQLLTGRGLEVPFLTAFRHMVGGISSGRFFLRTLCGSFRLDCTADTLILPFRKPIAKLVQHSFQMLLQRLTHEVLFNGVLPPPVQPQDDFFMLCHAHRPLSASLRTLLRAAWVWPQEQTYCPHTPAPLPGLPIHRAAAALPPCAAARKTAACGAQTPAHPIWLRQIQW